MTHVSLDPVPRLGTVITSFCSSEGPCEALQRTMCLRVFLFSLLFDG